MPPGAIRWQEIKSLTMTNLAHFPVEINIPVCLGPSSYGDLNVNARYLKKLNRLTDKWEGAFEIDSLIWNNVDAYPLISSLNALSNIYAALSSYLQDIEDFDLWQLEKYNNILLPYPDQGKPGNEILRIAYDGRKKEYDLQNFKLKQAC